MAVEVWMACFCMKSVLENFFLLMVISGYSHVTFATVYAFEELSCKDYNAESECRGIMCMWC